MPILCCALVTPLTGALALYGRATAAALQLWADLAATFQGVELTIIDANPDPAIAAQRAAAMDPHVIFGPYGSSTAVAAAGATSRLVWNHGGATPRLAWPDFPNVVNVLAPASTYFAGAIRAARDAAPAATTVSVLHGTTGFARDVAEGAAACAAAEGMHVRSVTFERGNAASAAANVPDADLLLVAGGFADELAAARVLLQRPWPAVGFVGAGVEEVLRDLGEAREGLLGPAQWTAATALEPDEGPDAGWFVDRYTRATGGAPAYPAAQAFACGLIAARCLRDAGAADDAALLQAAKRLRCTTLFGNFALDPASGMQLGHEVLTVQWQQGERRVVWPPQRAEASLICPWRHES